MNPFDNIHIGAPGAPPLDWRERPPADTDPDDEVLPETPREVVALLGFDPLELREGSEGK